jgi:hypothetical protein
MKDSSGKKNIYLRAVIAYLKINPHLFDEWILYRKQQNYVGDVEFNARVWLWREYDRHKKKLFEDHNLSK